MKDSDGSPTQPPIMIGGIYQVPAKILSTAVEYYDMSDPQVEKEIHRNYNQLCAVLDNTPNGIAIAANQAGIYRAMFVHRLYDGYTAVINPVLEMVSAEKEEVMFPEGCLSIPHLILHRGLMRYPVIKATYWEWPSMMKVNNQKMDKFEAQLFQHECDHLMGYTILDRLTEVE